MNFRKTVGFILGTIFVLACTRQHDPRAYWAQYKKERVNSGMQAPKLNADGTIPEVNTVVKASSGPGDAKYESLCASCHGADGAAASGAALAMNPKPRSFTDSAWHDKVNDEHIALVIKQGGAAAGLSATMPAWGAVVSDAEVSDLVKKVRSFKK
jgi:mono/diheme cytochrome c family protein